MGLIMQTATTLSDEAWKQLDRQLRQVDEDRWLSSRYASEDQRRTLTALYLLNYELARVRLAVTEPGLGAIRFQWWREALDAISDAKPSQHEVAEALSERVATGGLSVAALQSLVAGHEAAFEANDRSLEPEARLTAIAAKVFASAHGWGEVIVQIAPHCAALRRGEAVGFGPVVQKAPRDIRPAVAHLRLRRLMAKDKSSGPLSRRLCVMNAMLSGGI